MYLYEIFWKWVWQACMHVCTQKLNKSDITTWACILYKEIYVKYDDAFKIQKGVSAAGATKGKLFCYYCYYTMLIECYSTTATPPVELIILIFSTGL